MQHGFYQQNSSKYIICSWYMYVVGTENNYFFEVVLSNTQ